MRDFVAEKVADMPYSGIRKFFDVATELEGIVSLGVGEPDFFTPWNVREQAIYHIERKRTIYSSNSGLVELRNEISRYTERKYQLLYDPKSEILVTVGGSEAIDLSMRTIMNPGDEVLVVEPSFVPYKPCVTLAGGVPVVVETKVENDFRLTPEDILPKITSKTKAIIYCYPNNPTGAVMDRGDLEKIARIAEEHDLLVISDEIYAELTYGEKKHVSIASIGDMYKRTIVLNGFSKAFAMTGWRLGYACGPKDIISAMMKIHQYAIMCAPTTAQYAGIEALKNCDTHVANMVREYNARRKFMVKSFNEIGMDCFEPLGAFYVFPSVKKYAKGDSPSATDDFCTELLFKGKVAVVPGNAFGECGRGFVRCSYAYSLEELKTALDRISSFIK